jgi:hypothetical protein
MNQECAPFLTLFVPLVNNDGLGIGRRLLRLLVQITLDYSRLASRRS